MRTEAVRYRALTWAFIVVGMLIRLMYLGRPAYLDESATFIDYAKMPFAQIAGTYFDPNNHVLYSLLMRAAYLLFGFDVWALRLPAFLAGIAILPLTWLVARWLYDDRVAALATGLVAVSAPLIEYSVSGRGYSLMTAAFLVLLWLPSRRGAWRWGAVAVVSALGFWTLPTMLYPVGVVAVWWGIRYLLARDWRTLAAFGGALAAGAALTLLLYAPIIRGYGFEALAGNRHIVPLAYPDLAAALARLPRDGVDYLFIGLPRLLRITLAALPLTALLLGPRLTSERRFPLMLAAAVWLLAWTLSQRVIPPVRVWVWLAPLVAVWTAAGAVGLAGLAPRWLAGAVSVLLPLICGAFVLSADVNGGYAINSGAHDSAEAAEVLAALPPDAEVLFVAGWVHPLWYELERRGLPPGRVKLNRPPSDPVSSPAYLLALSNDPFLDERTREAFGTVFRADDLTTAHTFGTGEWTLYRVR